MDHDPIVSAFRDLVRRRPDDTLLVSATRRSTVGEVARLAERVSDRTRGGGIPAGSLVALLAPNGPAFFAGFLGLRAAGFKVLLVDASTPRAERARIHRSLGATAELSAPTGWPESEADFILEPGASATGGAPLPADVGTVRLTSGSTGTPRGIAHTSQALLTDDQNLRRTMDLGNERVLAAVPLSHAYGFASIFMPAVTCGWALAVPEGLGPFASVRAAEAGEVTFLPTVPAYLQALLKMDEPPRLPPSVRLVITAGAPLRPDTAALFHEVTGRRVHVFYGASEVGGIAYDREGGAAERGAIGPPVDGVRVELMEESGCEPGTGIIEIASPGASVGYHPDPCPDLAGGRFRTADLGTFDPNGDLRLLGRVDALVNVKGKKVYPHEVEKVIEGLDGVREAVVFGAPAADGSGDALHAAVADDETGLSPAEILAWCRGTLAGHKVPRRIVVIGKVPRNARGKIDHHLRRR